MKEERRGAPPKRGVAATKWIQLRVTERDKETIREAAGDAGISSFVIDAALDRARRILSRKQGG